MKTNKAITQVYPSSGKMEITIPAGTEIMHIPNAGTCSGYVVKNKADLVKAGAWDHDARNYYFYVPLDAIADLPADARHMRNPLKAKSDDWEETADQWLVNINGQLFDYYTGIGHREFKKSWPNDHVEYKRLKNAKLTEKGFEAFIAMTTAVPPKLDDVLHSLVMDASACDQSFEGWCEDYGSNPDSIKTFEIYRLCQKNADKLRKAGINIEKERERLADY